jgi:Family of unknown function (DUF6090)
MAVQEVVKHGKKAYGIWNKGGAFWHKLKDFFIEIVIIVFAVSLSIWLHGLSEHRHEQKQVKTFLLGLKKDIQEDINETKSLIVSYKNYDTVYTYLSSLRKDKTPDKDSLASYLFYVGGNAYLRPNTSRFNSFLSAGKILNVENDSLSIAILELYEATIPKIKSSENGWIERNRKLQDYLIDNVNDIENNISKWKVLVTPKGKYLCKSLIPWGQIFERYEDFIKEGESIIGQIEKMYGTL